MRDLLLNLARKPGSARRRIVELDGPRLSLLDARPDRAGIVIERWITAHRPESIVADDPVAIGAWLASVLREHAAPRIPISFAVSRGDVVLKRLSIPASPDTTEEELSSIVRLQMGKQLAMAVESAAIDYAPLAELGGSEASPARAVLAAAMPADRVAWYKSVAESAGLAVESIGLRCFGLATLLADLSLRRAGPVLGIALGAVTTEFVIVEDGQMVFARASDIARPAAASGPEAEGFAERVAMEAKRSWTTHRLSGTARPTSGEIDRAAIVGAGAAAQDIAARVGATMSVQSEVVALPSSVRWEAIDTENSADLTVAGPLAGIALGAALGRPSLDFSRPRRLPDRGARKRQLVLASALAAILGLGGGAVVVNSSLSGLDEQIALARSREAQLRKDYEQFLLIHAREQHVRQWLDGRVDWLSHLSYLSAQLPDPRLAQLDNLVGESAAAVRFQQRASTYPDGEWRRDLSTKLFLSGKVKQREAAEDLRGRLVAENVYTVEARGADVQDRFNLELTTTVAKPAQPAARAAQSPVSGGSQPQATPAPTAEPEKPGQAAAPTASKAPANGKVPSAPRGAAKPKAGEGSR
ncbi:MAG: pilus assembly protein PilM [Planctomycetota bacterium]|nr:pilus assembly protein PilM [Planctomycetota bacterium]